MRKRFTHVRVVPSHNVSDDNGSVLQLQLCERERENNRMKSTFSVAQSFTAGQVRNNVAE